MILTNRMLTFWMTINPADLQCSLIIYLVGVELDLKSNVTFICASKKNIINPVAMKKFFNITCKAVLLFFFISKYYNSHLLKFESIYFRTLKTNGHGILNLYYLV